MKNKKIVVIGGGHGQAVICRGIKLIDNVDISAIVTVADDGGSTGRLRKQFHIPAMGDIRNVMISLAPSESLMAALMDYRFESDIKTDDEDMDVQGHNLGNLILTAMTKSFGGFMEAITMVKQVLNVKGDIIPSTLDVITLYARMEDGTIVKGEDNIPKFNNRITEVFYDKEVKATKEAVKTILEADLIIFGIGSLYTSILPNIIIKDIENALRNSKAKKVYFCNVMSQPGETDGYSVEDHVKAIEKHGGSIDEVIISNDVIPDCLIKKYKDEGSSEVLVKEENHNYIIKEATLLRFDKNLIRHDFNKIKNVVEDLMR